jgi:hypothetical protein
MMRVATAAALSMVFSLIVSARGAELKSGPQKGEELGAYDVVKVAGNPHDGVKVGEELCYRCKMGNRPMVMVFARKADKNLAQLVKELDKVVAKNEEKKMGAFVALLAAKNEDKAKAEAEKLIKDTEAHNIAVVVPKAQPNGPEEYKINPEADVTVLIYKQGTVEANHALTKDGLNEKVTKQIIADTAKILN